jgi:hypothetical protein
MYHCKSCNCLSNVLSFTLGDTVDGKPVDIQRPPEGTVGNCTKCGEPINVVDEVNFTLGAWKDNFHETFIDAFEAGDGVMVIGAVDDIHDVEKINELVKPIITASCFFHREDETQYAIYATNKAGTEITHLWEMDDKGNFCPTDLDDSKPKKETFEVTVCQTVHREHTFTVTATDLTTAEAHATEVLALEYDWSDSSIYGCDYEV